MSLSVSVSPVPIEVFNIKQRNDPNVGLLNWPDSHLSRVVLTPGSQYRWIGSNGGKDGISLGNWYVGPESSATLLVVGRRMP